MLKFSFSWVKMKFPCVKMKFSYMKIKFVPRCFHGRKVHAWNGVQPNDPGTFLVRKEIMRARGEIFIFMHEYEIFMNENKINFHA